jgi:hypothetical protein
MSKGHKTVSLISDRGQEAMDEASEGVKLERTCVFCKRFCLELGEPDWPTTPGAEAQIGCYDLRWMLVGTNHTLRDYRTGILTAVCCPNWEPCQLWLEKAGV